MAQLRVFKDNGTMLFDTNLITYGLVKSGYMVYINSWTRKTLRSAQLDPNNGANWTQTVATAGTSFADSVYGFTIQNPQSPIVFITGSGCLAGTGITGNSMTFYYTSADANTRFYCFDLMSDTITGSPYLKTYNTSGRITFNSLQPPINVVAAIQAPPPGQLDVYGRYLTTYVNGANRVRQVPSGAEVNKIDSYVNVALSNEEYAAYLPFSRTCSTYDFLSGGTGLAAYYSLSEGVYGYNGGITFMFGAAGGTTKSNPSVAGWTTPISFENIPTDRYPIALVIRTSSYPFPYN